MKRTTDTVFDIGDRLRSKRYADEIRIVQAIVIDGSGVSYRLGFDGCGVDSAYDITARGVHEVFELVPPEPTVQELIHVVVPEDRHMRFFDHRWDGEVIDHHVGSLKYWSDGTVTYEAVEQ